MSCTTSVKTAVGNSGGNCDECFVCNCIGYTYKGTGTLTDVNGTYTLARVGTTWQCCYTISHTNVFDPSTGTVGTHDISITYILTCYDPDYVSFPFRISRQWWLNGARTTYWKSDCTTVASIASGKYEEIIPTCGPLFWSGTPTHTYNFSGTAPDPVGGAVSFKIEQCTGADSNTTCSPCNIPNTDLTASWTNVSFGNGSKTLTYSATGPTWTACQSQGGGSFQVSLACVSGANVLTVKVWTTSATCTGSPNYTFTSTAGDLTLTTTSCSPLDLVWTVNPSTVLYTGLGFRTFTATP